MNSTPGSSSGGNTHNPGVERIGSCFECMRQATTNSCSNSTEPKIGCHDLHDVCQGAVARARPPAALGASSLGQPRATQPEPTRRVPPCSSLSAARHATPSRPLGKPRAGTARFPPAGGGKQVKTAENTPLCPTRPTRPMREGRKQPPTSQCAAPRWEAAPPLHSPTPRSRALFPPTPSPPTPAACWRGARRPRWRLCGCSTSKPSPTSGCFSPSLPPRRCVPLVASTAGRLPICIFVCSEHRISSEP